MTMLADREAVGRVPAPAAAPLPRECNPAAVMLVSRAPAARMRLSRLFEEAGLAVLEASDLRIAREMMRTARLDLIVLECPSLIGDELAFCQTVAAGARVPLLLLAAAADVVDEILALELGADDLLAGEAPNRLVLARARALLRRTRRHEAAAAVRPQPPTGWRLDPMTRAAIGPSGRSVLLSPGHASAFDLFLNNPGTVFTCEAGAKALRGERLGAAAFRTIVSRLRQKLDSLPDGNPIQTVRGVGYSYSPSTPIGGSADFRAAGRRRARDAGLRKR
ncbi:winged helix-turn-helix domain-containing protein [Brevundimonas sp.]|uniref:winged helix-turn-helix domain-containing protein n=1 Tax=Brevundimonas sp. TaxID=1871086 RepID=UPI002D376EED|nr:winged helix-turn-helix domain-containing protein [Brevundimonas sp.]HYD27234.1 winged helix-turn-helix domain-containing protein [Brevundimonas sp.]